MIRQVLEYYGADLVDIDGWQKIRCPFVENHANSDQNPSASVNTAEDVFRCFACDVKGNSIGVLMKVEGLDFAGAKSKYEAILGRRYEPLSDDAFLGSGRTRPGISDEQRHYDRLAGTLSDRVRRRPKPGA